MRDRTYRPTLEALEDRVTPADFSGLNFGGLDFGALTSALPDFSGFNLGDVTLPGLTDLGNGLSLLQLSANQLANSNLLAGFSGLVPGPSSGLFGLNDAALSQFQLESQGLLNGSNLFGNLGTFVSGADTLNNFIQGDFAGTAISGLGTAFSLGGPLGAAASLGLGLGQNIGAPLLLSTQFGNDLVNNLSDTLLNIPGVNDALFNFSQNFDSLRAGAGDFFSNLGSNFSLPSFDLGSLTNAFDFGQSFDFGNSFDPSGFGGGDTGLFDALVSRGVDPQFAADAL